MNIPQNTLNGWRARVGMAWGLLSALRYDIAGGKVQQAQERRAQAEDALRLLALDMEKDGADAPPDTVVLRPAVPLALLNTPANRRYADALRFAWEAGMAVDRERYGEDIGTDGTAQVLEMLLENTEAELHGPAGLGE